MTDGKHGRTLGVSSGKSVRLAALLSLQVTISIPTAYAEAPPLPSKTSLVGQTVTNPITGSSTTVSVLRVDPAGTPTAGNTAFVQTADGYTFLVKTAGEVFYNSDAPPVAFVVTSVDGDKAVVTGTQATGSEKFALVQSTVAFNDSFNSSGSEGILTPPVDVSGPNGVKQVVYGQNGSNGRVGALFVPPSSGGNGSGGPTNTQTLSGNVNATSNIGWEIGSVGGSGGKGGNSYASFWSGRDGGDGGLGGNVIATQATSSIIKTTDDANHGIFTYSRSGEAGDGGGGFAAPGGGTGGHSSSGGDVTVNQYGVIATDGQNAHGIYALSVSNNGGNGGDQWGLVGKAGSGGYGGNGGQVNVNTYAGAQIITEQDYSNGIFAQSIGGSGSSAGTSGNLLVSLIGQADNGGDGSTVTVSNGGEIQTKGVASRGIMAQSIGGGGGAGGTAAGLVALAMGGVGSNGGSGGAVSVTNTGTGTIHTLGDLADGIMAQSIGGSGGQGANAYGLVSIGGSGSKGGSGSTVSVTNYGRIDTEGNGARGIIAQSIGGGGGDGGSSGGMVAVGGSGAGGGAGLTVNVTNDGIITTKGDDAKGILAQSIGGGGGNGCSSGSVGAFASVGIGGKGGAGGVGGNVDVTLSNTDVSKPLLIATSGDRSTGVFVQSIGGGGGNGGGAVSVAVGAVGAVSVSVGGEGGRGGAGGTTMLTGSGDAAVQTEGADAAGILLQSVGGGGGNGGYAISAAASAGPIAGALAVGIGGSGGLGGAGGEVRVGALDGSGNLLTPGFSGSVVTTGERSAGMIFQSVGGGDGSTVAATVEGNVTTEGTDSTAILAQSVGGGGGNGGFNISGAISGSGVGSGAVSVGLGGGGGIGAIGDAVTLTSNGYIQTQGDRSSGFVAQSIGGGGGNAASNTGLFSEGLGLEKQIGGGRFTSDTGAVLEELLSEQGEEASTKGISVAVGGGTGAGGASADVIVEHAGAIDTQGADSHGIFAQSVGGGGGNGGSNSLKTGGNDGNASISIGRLGGTGGTAGNVRITSDGPIHTQGNRSHGLFAQSIGNGGGNSTTISASLSTPKNKDDNSYSVAVNVGLEGGSGGKSGNVKIDADGSLYTQGNDSHGIFAQSVGGGGGNAGGATGSVGKAASFSFNIGGKGGAGGVSGDVDVASKARIVTEGSTSIGIFAQSIGGTGGTGGFANSGVSRRNIAKNIVKGDSIGTATSLNIGGSGGDGMESRNVTVTNGNVLTTRGDGAHGIMAQSVGGGGGKGGLIENLNVSLHSTIASTITLSIGGNGGTGARSGDVSVTNTSDIGTQGKTANGIFAQAVGGGGGDAQHVRNIIGGQNTEKSVQTVLMIGGKGGSGGVGGKVDVRNETGAKIITDGNESHGIFAQSIGGGGGNGGEVLSVTVTKPVGTDNNEHELKLGIGGNGAQGGTGGMVNVINDGLIITRGDKAHGIFAQSIGGDGADGGNVTVNHSGTIRVSGENSYGIFAQSVGGGGGKAALSISNPAVMAADYIISTVMGARTGTKGKAGLVTVNSTGDIIVTGAGSQAIFSQSVNGGGGNVDTFINLASANNGTTNSAAGATLTSSLSLGGNDVDGNSAAAISQSHHGDIVTTSDRSAGLLMQSIGGGGGLSTTTIASSIAGDFTLNAMLGAINTDESSGGDVTAARKGNVSTFGNLSGGGLAQSIGGGGGRLIISGADRSEGSSERNAVVKLGADPSMRNNGGAVTLTLNGTVSTQGDNASGQIIQSIGAGGGEVYLAGIDHAQLTLGASDGSTGDGGNISVDNIGDLSTTGALSHGFVLQSIGGGGGLVGTNLATTSIELLLSNDNSGNGGAIDFSNQGNVVVTGMDSIGVLAQSLGGGGGSVDGLFHGSAGGNGQGGNIMLDLTGNILSLGERGIAVLAQSEGKDGADKINVGLDGVIIGGVNGQPDNRAATETAAVMIDGGTSNMLALSSKSFLMALNNRIISGSGGSDQVTLNGRAVGNIDLGGGVNSMIVSKGASFYAQNEVNLGASGQLRIDGNLYLGGVAYYTPNTSLSARMAGSEFGVTQNVSQTTALTGSLSFGNTATYTADVYFRQDTVAGGQSDLINVTGDATIAGTVIPVLHQLDRLQPLVLVNAGGVTADNGTTVVGTPVMSYEIGLNGPTGDGSSIDLIPHADFRMIGMTRNQTLTAKHAARVLSGQGTVAMGPMLALIANM